MAPLLHVRRNVAWAPIISGHEITLEIPPEMLQGAVERRHGAGGEGAESVAGVPVHGLAK